MCSPLTPSLTTLFSRYGTVTDAHVKTFQKSKEYRSRGFGFVTFADEEAVTEELVLCQVLRSCNRGCDQRSNAGKSWLFTVFP